jgi:hypothetical protein
MIFGFVDFLKVIGFLLDSLEIDGSGVPMSGLEEYRWAFNQGFDWSQLVLVVFLSGSS